MKDGSAYDPPRAKQRIVLLVVIAVGIGGLLGLLLDFKRRHSQH
jgi:hypothetical protein